MGAYCQQKSFKVEVYGNGQPIILIPGIPAAVMFGKQRLIT